MLSRCAVFRTALIKGNLAVVVWVADLFTRQNKVLKVCYCPNSHQIYYQVDLDNASKCLHRRFKAIDQL